MTKRLLAVIFVFAVLTGCRNLTVPSEAPAAVPGTLQGTLVFSEPGRPGYVAAAQAKVQVLSTGLSATADDEGRFLLGGMTASTGVVLVEHERDGVKRQRTLRLQDVGAGLGRDISLGQVVLSRNAVVRGRVTLEGQPNGAGLGGTTVFVPGGPWSALTADDGSYALDALPEGALQVAFFHAGYAVSALDVQLAPGEEQALRTVQLVPTVDGPATVRGKVVKADGSAAENVEVRLRSRGMEQRVAVSGDGFSQGDLTAGVYAFAIERDGSLSIAVYNVALLPGDNDLGTFELIDGTSSDVNLGTGEPMAPGDGGMTDGGNTISMDAGSGPFAVATGPEVAAPGSQVTVNGMGSTGDFPLIYRWVQTAGTAVTLSTNDTPLAHSPRFTAPAAGTVVELKLVVEDRLGNLSAPSTVRVGIGTKPVARFTPDGGAVFPGGQMVSFTSTSFDDAGVVLTFHDWKLASGSGGTLMSDGGATAFWQTPPVNFGDPDAIGGITLQVTNGIGVRSTVATQLYTVHGVSPNNWTLDAGPTQTVVVGAAPPQVQLAASISAPLISNPPYSVNWSCSPNVALLNKDTLTPRFVAPLVVGPTQTLTCDVTATGQFPLSPLALTGSASVLLRDGAPPTVVSSNVEPTRMGRFGLLVHASEPLSAATLTVACNPSLAYGLATGILFNSAIAGTQYSVMTEGASCSAFQADLTDKAQFPNVATNQAFGNGSVVVSTVWAGPYVSSATFADPRPVLSTLSQVPNDAQEAAGVIPGSVVGYELVGSDNASLLRFTGLDVSQRPTCNPSCTLNNMAMNLGLPVGTAPSGRRTTYAGAELFVSTSTDGGVAPFVARRNAAGTWSAWAGMSGSPDNWGTELRTSRFESSTGRILVDTWSPSLQQFTTTDIAATGLAEVALVASASNVLAAASGPTRQLMVRKRNTTDLSWSAYTLSGGPYTDVASLKWEPMSGGVTLLGTEATNMGGTTGLFLVRVDTGGVQTISTTPVKGYDMASWGGNVYVVYSSGGDIRFKTIAGSVWSGAGGGPLDFGGPPRPGFSAPYPVALDNDPACEAVYPTMAFVEDALVISWQERCSPATAWNVVARTVR